MTGMETFLMTAIISFPYLCGIIGVIALVVWMTQRERQTGVQTGTMMLACTGLSVLALFLLCIFLLGTMGIGPMMI